MNNPCTAGLLFTTSALLAATTASAEGIYLLEDVGTSQQLSFVDSATPGEASGRVAITGLGDGVELEGIDFRPATGDLFALSSSDALYTIDTATGAATLVGSGFTDAPNGSFFGFDFNPTIDRIRIVSNTNTNFVANPDTGDANVATTTSVFYEVGDENEGANPNVIGTGYTNSVADATTTQLFAIDSGLDVLVTQANNAGTLATVGSLGVDIIDISEFDISGESGVAYLAGIVNGEDLSTLFSVDLTTGAATAIGQLGSGLTVAGLAVAPGAAPTAIPSPAALPAGLLLLTGLVARRRRRVAG